MRLRQAQADNFDSIRNALGFLAGHAKVNEYCGLPVPISGETLVLEPRHPAFNAYAEVDRAGADYKLSCSNKDVDEEVALVNMFYSHRERCEIVIYKVGDKIEWGRIPALNNVEHQFSTMACSVAWSVEAETKALKTLSTLIPPHLYRMYFLSGMFLETSKRSGVTYIFRKLRPTIAMRPHPERDSMKILCCLCLHPIGYYQDSWAGAMCPTDDVLAVLLLMRGDEKMFWRRANQIAPHRPNAGL